MTLNFMQEFPDGTPTHFVDKVCMSIHTQGYCPLFHITSLFDDCVFDNIRKKYIHLTSTGLALQRFKRINHPKVHTIREGFRWKVGTKIHFKIWTGKPYVDKTFNFLPLLPCKGVQEIEFKWQQNPSSRCVQVFIDGKNVTNDVELINKLALNDGFDNRKDFFEWFKDDFKGQIIHWTDLKY